MWGTRWKSWCSTSTPKRRRISLGMKQCKPNPWEEFAANHKKGDAVKGTIRSITDFGIFVGVDGGIDGLVHLSDLSWDRSGEEAVTGYKKGDEVTVSVVSVDAERERISLGVKQLTEDPFVAYINANGKGSIVKGVVGEVTAKGAGVELGPNIRGYLRVSEISRERVEDARTALTKGDEIEAKITSIERKERHISLSVKLMETDLEGEMAREYVPDASLESAKLGDKLKGKTGQGFLIRLLQGRPIRFFPFRYARYNPQTGSIRGPDQVRTDRRPRPGAGPADRTGCRPRGQHPPRPHVHGPGQRRAHRDSRLRQHDAALPAGAHRAQPAHRQRGAGCGKVRAVLQAGRETAHPRPGRRQKSRARQTQTGRVMKKPLYMCLIAAVVLFGATFSHKNPQAIDIHYYFGVHFRAPLPLLLLAVFALGLAGGCLALLPNALGARLRLARARRQLRALQSADS